jgi:thiosulfate/3-mercaptopyruvate sulfurtransferase
MTNAKLVYERTRDSSARSDVKKPGYTYLFGALIILLAFLAPLASGGCGCGSGAIGNWDPTGFLNSELGSPQVGSDQTAASSASATDPIDRIDTFPNSDILISVKSVSSSDLLVDVSSADSYARSHAKKAISFPAEYLLQGDGSLIGSEDLARLLGEAGISAEDSMVIYGSSESSGEPGLAFFALRYMGHQDVKLMDGDVEDWKEAGLPVESSENILPAREYQPSLKSKYLADYEYVTSGQVQIVDARPLVEYGKGRIQGSTALDPDNVVKGDSIRDGEALNMVFSRLSKDQSIVVYSDDYHRSSLVWYALQLMGYDSSIYTWNDWVAHEFTDVKSETAEAGGNAASSKYVRLGET